MKHYAAYSMPEPLITTTTRILLAVIVSITWLSGCGIPETPIGGTLANLTTPTEVIATPAYPDAAYWDESEKALIEELREELAQPGLSPETREAIEAQLAPLERLVSQQATALTLPTADTTHIARLTSDPQDRLAPPLGILEDTEDAYDVGMIVKNRWQGEYNATTGALTQVFAGASSADPQQGVVAIVQMTMDGSGGGWYPTPTKSGAIRIEADQYPRLTLRADTGTVFIFNLVTRAWEQSTPTATPAPTATPRPTSGPCPRAKPCLQPTPTPS